MRVIAGSAKRIQLKTIEGFDTRPTTDRIKETLFNMISEYLADSTFLDLFSGSGGIGIEALSRGASGAVFVEQSKKAMNCIKENLQVTKLADKNNNVEVQAGAVKMRIKVEKLRLLDKKPQKPTANKAAPTMRRTESTPQAVKSSLDLRGMTVDEAILEVDRFIDMSLRTSLNEFTIIHGKGTGALRSAVQSYLRGSTFVKSFRLGTFGEGESGVTIVELK
ncbi:MAG: RsmD family RNA methyltransferase [Clostridia bacterium]|nr:RsmD family RNA methyltransferase [Clostridia bacterium]